MSTGGAYNKGKIKSFLVQAIKQAMIADLDKRHHSKSTLNPVSEQFAETLIQEFENIIRSDTARVLDEKVEDLKSHIAKVYILKNSNL